MTDSKHVRRQFHFLNSELMLCKACQKDRMNVSTESQRCGHHAVANTMAHMQENPGPNPCNGSVFGCAMSLVLLLSLGQPHGQHEDDE